MSVELEAAIRDPEQAKTYAADWASDFMERMSSSLTVREESVLDATRRAYELGILSTLSGVRALRETGWPH